MPVIAAIVAVVLIGYGIWEMKVKPEKAVKRIEQAKKELSQKATVCSQTATDKNAYEKTFSLANTIGDREFYNSASASSALEYALKQQLNGTERSDRECYKLMNEAGKKIEIDIPMLTDKQIMQQEYGGGRKVNSATDVKSAVYDLCQAYNDLRSCMETFVSTHVNNSDINEFKDSATENFGRFQRQSGKRARGQ